MNFKLPLFLFLLLSTFVNAQQTMSVKGSKPFPATENYTFICEKYVLTGEVDVQIAKTDKGGILKLTIATTNDKTRISGGVYVDLVNGDVIACVDKNNKETGDGKTTSYYYFTPAELLKLKKLTFRQPDLLLRVIQILLEIKQAILLPSIKRITFLQHLINLKKPLILPKQLVFYK